MMTKILVIDFETYYSTEYSLTRMTTEEYVRNEQFQALCLGVADWYGGPNNGFVIEGSERIATWIKEQDWSKIIVICHHAQFDCFILSHIYNVKPLRIMCTLSMAHAIYGTLELVSLEALAIKHGLEAKSVPYNMFRGKRWGDMDGDLIRQLSAGCLHDVELTRNIAIKLLQQFPKQELIVVDLTVRTYTEPKILGDTLLWRSIEKEEATRKNEAFIELNVTEKQLQSTAKFKELLEEFGEEVPSKRGKNGLIPCVAATDEYMQELSGRDDKAGALARARMDVRSTIVETRTGRLANMAERGPLPVYLKYFAACTSRWGGGERCLSGDTKVLTFDPQNGLLEKLIVNVMPDDLVWDGEEFVPHEGVIFQGFQEVIEYDGITGTPSHQCYTFGGGLATLVDSKERGVRLECAREPTSEQIYACRKYYSVTDDMC